MKIYEHEYCIRCGKENLQDKEICDCGGRDFIFGDKFAYVDKEVICDCGSKEFKMLTHMDFTNYANTTYACIKCGNPVAKQIHREI